MFLQFLHIAYSSILLLMLKLLFFQSQIVTAKMLSVWFLALVASSLAQQDPVIQRDRAGVVQLFEWHYETIADECEKFLGPMKYGAVQVRSFLTDDLNIRNLWQYANIAKTVLLVLPVYKI